MLKIRLQKVGRKNDASFRVVVIESQRGPKAGNALEVLGFYDPKKDIIEIKSDRITHWVNVGAQVSPTVHNLLIKEKIIVGDKINVLSRKSPIKKKKEDTSQKSEKFKTAETQEKSDDAAGKSNVETTKEEVKKPEEGSEKPKQDKDSAIAQKKEIKTVSEEKTEEKEEKKS